MNKRPLIASPPWTAADDERLRTLAMAGKLPTVIADELQRSAAAVRHRFYKLGIPLPGAQIRGRKGEGKKNFASHHERQFMEYLRGLTWIKERLLPPTDRLAPLLLEKGWIEKQRQDDGNYYRMTEVGLAAYKAPVPIQKSWSKPQKAK